MNWRRVGKLAAKIAAGLLALALVLLVVSIVVVQTSWFQNFVRQKIVSVTEESTGGRVEIGSFEFQLWRLQAHVRDFVLHGKESASEAPLFRAQKIDLRLKLLAGLKKTVDLEYLGVDQASANVIVYPDGSTNVPEPKVVKKSNKLALETVVDLAIHQFEISNTSIAFAQQSVPLTAHGTDLRTQLAYRMLPAGYTGSLHVGALHVVQGKAAPLNGTLDLPVEIGKDSIDVKGGRLTTEKSQIVMEASISHMDSPQISAHAIAHISLEEVQKTAGLAADLCEGSVPCFVDGDFTIRESAGNLQEAPFQLNVTARGMTAELKGSAKLNNNQLAITSSISTGGVALHGYAGAANGDVSLTDDLNAKGSAGLRARANLRIVPGGRGVPVRGEIHANYNGAADSVDFAHSNVVLAHSRVDFAGTLGRHLDVKLVSTDTKDFAPLLAMPVTLNRGGQITANANVDGAITNPQISGTAEATNFAMNSRPFDRLNATFTASKSGVTVRDGTLARQTLLARFSGSVRMRDWNLDNRSALQVDADLQNGDIADALALAGEPQIPAKGALTASAKIGGTVGNPVGTIRVNALNGVVYDQPFDRASLDVELADQLIKLTSSEIALGNARVNVTGTYSHNRENLLEGTANLRMSSSGVELATIAPLTKMHVGLNGTVQLNATATAKISETEILLSSLNADVQANSVRDAKQNYGNLTAHVDSAGSRVNARADSNMTGAAIHVAGSTTLPTIDLMKVAKAELKDFPLSADVSIQNASIEPLLALTDQKLPVSGKFGLTGKVNGTVADPTGTASITLNSAVIYGEPVDSMTADVRLEEQLAELRSLTASSPAGSIRASGTFRHPRNRFDEGEIEFKTDSAGLRLARVRNVRDANAAIDGTLKLSLNGAATLAANRELTVKKLDGNVNASAISYNGKAFGDAAFTAESRNGAIALRGTSNFASSKIEFTGEAKPTANLPITATVTISNLRYSNLRPYLSGNSSIQPDFDATLEARASVNGPALKPELLNASIEVPRLEMTTKQGIALKNDGTIALDYSQQTLRIRNAHLTGPSTEITAAGTAQFSGASPLNLTVKANTDLKLLEQIDKDIHASGSVALDTLVRGAATQPMLSGSAELKNASINFEGISNGIANANGTIALRGETASITNLTAESGGGKLTLTGFATRNAGAFRYTLRANASHVRTRYQGVSVVNSANLTMAGTTDRSVINGTVTVERAGFNPQSDIGSMLAELAHGNGPKATGASSSGVMSSIRLDIRVRTAPDARFQTTFAQTLEAQADVTVTGTLEQAGMVGRVTISQGDMIFFGNQYTVNRGLVAFYNPGAIEPQINISLATTVKNINVTLTVQGPMDNLKLSYVSDPPLQFDEIVSLLATGKRPSSDPAIVASQAPAPSQSVGEMGASALVSQTVASPLASRLQRVFGVSQLRIDPTFAGGSALPIARLTLQQRVSNTITFTYSQDLSQSNSELIRVEWAMTPKFSAVATRDENGIFGMDFFYKRQFR